MKNICAYIFVSICFIGLVQSIEVTSSKKASFDINESQPTVPATPKVDLSQYTKKINDLESKITEQNDLIATLRKDYQEAKGNLEHIASEHNSESDRINNDIHEMNIQVQELSTKYNSCLNTLRKKEALIESYKNSNLETVIKSFINNIVKPITVSYFNILSEAYNYIINALSEVYYYLHSLPVFNTIFSFFENIYNKYLASYVNAYLPVLNNYKKSLLAKCAILLAKISYQYGTMTSQLKTYLKQNKFTRDYADLIFNILISVFSFLILLTVIPYCFTIIYNIFYFPFYILTSCCLPKTKTAPKVKTD